MIQFAMTAPSTMIGKHLMIHQNKIRQQITSTILSFVTGVELNMPINQKFADSSIQDIKQIFAALGYYFYDTKVPEIILAAINAGSHIYIFF